MKVYFLSAEPCALTLNDVYFGITDRFERFVEISPKDKIYARFSPQNKQSIGFFITEALRFSPPNGCSIYLLPDGIAVYAWDFPTNDSTLRIHTQARNGDTLYTLFEQNRLQLSIQNADSLFVAYLPPIFQESELLFFEELCILKAKNDFAVYDKRANCLLQEHFLAFSLENGRLHATLPLSDSQNRTAECAWDLQGGTCTSVHFSIRYPNHNTPTPPDLIAYAFFESLLIGADPTPFLSEELHSKISKLRDFIGDFQEVLPMPNADQCGLIKKKAERVFEVCLYTIVVENGKITDVRG